MQGRAPLSQLAACVCVCACVVRVQALCRADPSMSAFPIRKGQVAQTVGISSRGQ